MSKILKYRLWCNTEQANKYVWAADTDPVPTQCPTNTAHTIDESKTAVVDTVKEESITDYFNKLMVHQTSCPIGTVTGWAGQGDDPDDPTALGGGTSMALHHQISDGMETSLYCDFNIKENDTYIHEGFIEYMNALNDYIYAQVVPVVTESRAGTDTNFNSVGGVIVPAAGDGLLIVEASDMKLVQVFEDVNTKIKPAAYWNADYNTETHQFSNITAAPAGNGDYNMFSEELPLKTFWRKIHLLGSAVRWMQSADAVRLGCNMRIKLTFGTTGDDHEWWANVIAVLHRERI